MNALYSFVKPIVIRFGSSIGAIRVLACGSLVLLAACAHDLGLMKKDETLNAYRAAIRWNEFERAAAFQSEWAPSRRASENLEDVRVTGYEIVASREDKERLTLNQTVEIRYYRTADLIERATRDEQAWRYDPVRERWVLDSALPRFNK